MRSVPLVNRGHVIHVHYLNHTRVNRASVKHLFNCDVINLSERIKVAQHNVGFCAKEGDFAGWYKDKPGHGRAHGKNNALFGKHL